MPRVPKSYKLVPAAVPSLAGRGSSVYAEAVADFVESGMESALVEMTGRKTQALTLGLRKAIEASGKEAKVVTRAGRVYLVRV